MGTVRDTADFLLTLVGQYTCITHSTIVFISITIELRSRRLRKPIERQR